MDTLTVDGIVPTSFYNQNGFYLQICEKDQAKAAKFFEEVDTVLRADRIAVRKKEFVAKCKAGDLVRYTLEKFHGKAGIRTRAIDCVILSLSK